MEEHNTETDVGKNHRRLHPMWLIALGMVVLVGGTSIFLYGKFDYQLADSLYDIPASVPQERTHKSAGGLDELAERLKQKLVRNPDNAEGWALLARSYVELDRHHEAIPAFEKAVQLIRDDAQLLADYADALGMINGGRLNDQADQLIQQASNLDPTNVKVRLLAATTAFNRQQYGDAIEIWNTILSDPSIEPNLVNELSGNIQEARSLQGGTTFVTTFPQKSSIPFDPSLRGIVNLDSQIQQSFSATDTLFIFARAVSGPPMPVAVVRATGVDFPYSFYLDDAHSVMPGRKLSEAGEVVVIARVSKSGDAIANTGDLEGKSAQVKPGDHEVRILIDAELP